MRFAFYFILNISKIFEFYLKGVAEFWRRTLIHIIFISGAQLSNSVGIPSGSESRLVRILAKRDASLAVAKRAEPTRVARLPAARPRSPKQAVRPRRAVCADAAHHDSGALRPLQQPPLRTGAQVQPRDGAVARKAARWCRRRKRCHSRLCRCRQVSLRRRSNQAQSQDFE
jgi:IS5 family transposase